ncbi:MAG: hypothetical protein H7062_04850 [Candidatus Saccharimonas sp.]|nr:hypothetical protein [Planctomycetaceae bacterium]
MTVSSHGFELALISVIAFISLALGAPYTKVVLTFFETLTTIALVHCIDAGRTINDRISRLGDNHTLAHELGNPSVAKEYRVILDQAKFKRSFFYLLTAITLSFWIIMSVCYGKYIAVTSSHQIVVAGVGSSHETKGVPAAVHGTSNGLVSDATNPRGMPASTGEPVGQMSRDDQISKIVTDTFSSTDFLITVVVFSGIVCLAIAFGKVLLVSVRMEELDTRHLFEKLNIAERLKQSDSRTTRLTGPREFTMEDLRNFIIAVGNEGKMVEGVESQTVSSAGERLRESTPATTAYPVAPSEAATVKSGKTESDQ